MPPPAASRPEGRGAEYLPRMSSKVACSWSWDRWKPAPRQSPSRAAPPTQHRDGGWAGTHVEDGNDGGVVPAEDGGDVFSFGHFRGDELGTTRGPLSALAAWEPVGSRSPHETPLPTAEQPATAVWGLTMTLGGTKPSVSQATASRPLSVSQSRSSKASPKVQCELCRSLPVGQDVPPGLRVSCSASCPGCNPQRCVKARASKPCPRGSSRSGRNPGWVREPS